MHENHPTLHLVCGKIAAGKSTLAARLAAEPQSILISEDRWLSALYPGEMNTVRDYVHYSARLRGVMGPHVEALLRAGLSVILDFPANTVDLRRWMRNIFESGGASHQLHFLDIADDVCKRRMRRRNEDGSHAFAPSDSEFDLISSYFEPPMPQEGFNILVHREG